MLKEKETGSEKGSKFPKVTQRVWGQCGPRARAGHEVPLPSCLACSSSPLGFVSPSEWAQNGPSFLPAALPAVCHVGRAARSLLAPAAAAAAAHQPRPTRREFAQNSQGCRSRGWAGRLRQTGRSEPAGVGREQGLRQPPTFPVLPHPHQPRKGGRRLGLGAWGRGVCV